MMESGNFIPVGRNGTVFFISPLLQKDKFMHFPDGMDAALLKGKILKNSRSTTASVVSVDFYSEPVFLKRTNRKGLSFVLKYLFRRARSFRAADGILHLMNAGISTPRLLAWGEKRTFGLLKAGYLMTEFIPNAKEASECLNTGEPARVIGETASLITAMHRCGIFHGDCKLQNFYCADGHFGVWDLDGAEYYPHGVPREKQLKDLGRLAWSCRELNCPLSDEEICSLIAEHCPPETKICRHCVAKALQGFAERS